MARIFKFIFDSLGGKIGHIDAYSIFNIKSPLSVYGERAG